MKRLFIKTLLATAATESGPKWGYAASIKS